MNYDIAAVVPTPDVSQIKYAALNENPFGDIPMSMLAAKYEETDDSFDHETAYHEFARVAACDNRPDRTVFAAEEPRGRNDASKGYLNLLHNGHRGDAEPPRHPEMFLGFGPEDRDPRGIALEPNMALMARQQDARGRFINFTAENDQNITGGGRSETKAIADNMAVRNETKFRFRQFSRQLDGRREGLHRTWDNVSLLSAVHAQSSYGDKIKDWSLNPQRRAVVIAQNIVHDSRLFTDPNDQDMQFVVWGQNNRRYVRRDRLNRVSAQTPGVFFADADRTMCFRAAALLMQSLSKYRTESQGDFAKSDDTVARKTANAQRDLIAILSAVTSDQGSTESDNTLLFKTAKVELQDHLARLTQSDADTPAHVLINAELIRKHARSLNKMQTIKEVVGDARSVNMETVESALGKSARHGKPGARNAQFDIGDADTTPTQIYKQSKGRWVSGGKAKGAATIDIATESDNSRIVKSRSDMSMQHRDNAQLGIGFANNTAKNRHGGKLGSKFLRSAQDVDVPIDTKLLDGF